MSEHNQNQEFNNNEINKEVSEQAKIDAQANIDALGLTKYDVTNNESQENAETKNEAETSTEWFYADGLKGEGDAPDWFYKDKYKSVEEQAKAAAELRKKLGERTGAPENYQLSIDEEKAKAFNINKEDESFKNFEKFAKDLHLSQEGFDQLLNMHLESLQGAQMSQEQQQEYYKSEIEKFGGDEKFKTLINWGENNLSESESKTFKDMITNAEQAALFDKLRNMTRAPKVPSEQPANIKSKDEINSMWLDPRVKTDPEFQKELLNHLANSN